ncbi:MAG: hypothetical protein ACQER0_03305 [Bacillota bacterium]
MIVIYKKLAVLKDIISMYISQHRNHLSYIFGFLTALSFSLIYLNYGVELSLLVLLVGILLFEVFNHFFGSSPEIIVMGVDNEQDIMKKLKKTMSEVIKEKNEEKSKNDKD